MGKTYELSADAILYAVILCQEPQIYGVKNVLLGLEPSQFAGYAQKTQTELMEQNCGRLQFDGNFKLNEDFEQLIKRCSSCKKIVGVDKKWKKQRGQLTCYISEQGVDVLELVEDTRYLLHENVDMVEKAVEYMGLPKGNEELLDVSVDSSLVSEGDKTGLKEAGCNSNVAELLTGAFQGSRRVVVVSKLEEASLVDSITYLYGEEGIMEAVMQYDLQKEMLCLTAVTGEDIKKRLGALL